ncbi:carbon-nitrogen hydrolase family protein [Calderihabitans maritimus]|uniref:CN hydrolase domain-containing protein n=1 Tax=Calderihabitans maritimus TaxID=1246530 RepID=A0A1Z5HNM0_9FIRM|nr:carbon-nitrogen hydrolase family protein [Calderihabitans maritimus]GAW90977.1 hypothetical protein KKC1_01390 [Calderihabitans maritimus]
MAKFLAAAVQMDTQEHKDQNLKRAEELIGEAADRGASLVALPETFNFMGSPREEKANAEYIPGPTIQRMVALAEKYKIWLHCGSILEKAPETEKLYNTSVLLNPRGEIVARYRKLHLFDVELSGGPVSRESKTREFGKSIVVTDTDLGRVGFSICYDLRFPELYRIMALEGAEMIFVPAAFTMHTGKDHWEPLLRARAIENQCYIIAPGQTGKKKTYTTYGKSMIVDPWGNVLGLAPEGESVVVAEIDLNYLRRVREQIPSLKNRRPDIYQVGYAGRSL